MDGHNQQLRKQPLPSIKWLRENLGYDKDTGEVWWAKAAQGRRLGRSAGSIRSYHRLEKRWVIRLSVGGRRVNLYRSRVAFALMEGRWPDCIDHVNGDKLDDRWENLREVTNAENLRNLPKYRNNTSGSVGVYWCADRSKWRVRIKVLGAFLSLGYYADFDSAVQVRKSAELKYGFHENHGR
jgi:hypothetical protein